MNYLLYGSEEYLIKLEINKIKEKYQIDDQDVSSFNLQDESLKDILDNASTFSLFSNKRLIIIENSYIFTGATGNKSQDTKYLEKYLENPNQDTILIFTIVTDKLDSRKKIVTLFKEKGQVLELNDINVRKLVLDMFGNYKIDSANLNLLIDRVGNNLNILNQEINKIKTYKGEDLLINESDILNLTTKTIDTDIFHLIDNIVLKNKKNALESYYEMIKLGEEPIKIIVILANQFRLIYQVKILSSKRNSIYDMMSILGQKKYPIEKAQERSRKFSNEILIEYLKKLAELDVNIKSGKIDKNIGLELFMLEN